MSSTQQAEHAEHAEHVEQAEPVIEMPVEPTEATPLLGQRRRRLSLVEALNIITRPAINAFKRVRQALSPEVAAEEIAAAAEATAATTEEGARERRRPSIVEYVEYLATKIAHPFTPTSPPTDRILVTHAQALRSITNHVMSDFSSAHIAIDRLAIVETILRVLRDANHWAAVQDNFLGQSWKTREDVLDQLFGLEDASDRGYSLPESTTAFYVRSRRLDVTNVQMLVDIFRKRFHHPGFVQKMELLVEEAEATGQRDVYLRYIGTCTSPSTPASRIEDDLRTTASLFGKVDICLQQLLIEGDLTTSGEAWNVREFMSARISATESETLEDRYTQGF
ncbi:hypothetical protein SpCBS45565_g01905 [Spizellomyces sp. 'palustris']|nr:hypothetical protein SpCBS45565_g01905 [Spizellomyces sp. 'palustris']